MSDVAEKNIESETKAETGSDGYVLIRDPQIVYQDPLPEVRALQYIKITLFHVSPSSDVEAQMKAAAENDEAIHSLLKKKLCEVMKEPVNLLHPYRVVQKQGNEYFTFFCRAYVFYNLPTFNIEQKIAIEDYLCNLKRMIPQPDFDMIFSVDTLKEGGDQCGHLRLIS